VSFSGPIVITQGGTYSGNWQSTDPSVPAVNIQTTEAVMIVDSRIKGPGDLIDSGVGSTLTVLQSCFAGTNPNKMGQGKGSPIHSYQAASLRVENCDFVGGGFYGIWFQQYGGNHSLDNTITILRNRVYNVDGRLSDGNGGYLETLTSQQAAAVSHAIILDHVLGVPGIEIGWNEIINEPYEGGVGDSINIYDSSGTSASPMQIHDNYIQGGYDSVPSNARGLPYYGSAFTTDGSPNIDPSLATAFLKIHDNQAVNFGNVGIGIALGHDIEMYSNRTLSSGLLKDGTIITDFAAGIGYTNYLNDPSGVFGNNSVHDNLSGRRNYQGGGVWQRDDYSFSVPPTISFNNVSWTPATSGAPTLGDEANELLIWHKKLTAGGVTVGSTILHPSRPQNK
jgi:hypothetical protein